MTAERAVIDGSRMSDAQVLMLGLIAQRGVNGITVVEVLDALSVLMPERNYNGLRNFPKNLSESGWCCKALHDGVPSLFPGLRALDAATQLRADALMQQVALVKPVLRTATRTNNRPRYPDQPAQPQPEPMQFCRSVFEWRGSLRLNPKHAVEHHAV